MQLHLFGGFIDSFNLRSALQQRIPSSDQSLEVPFTCDRSASSQDVSVGGSRAELIDTLGRQSTSLTESFSTTVVAFPLHKLKRSEHLGVQYSNRQHSPRFVFPAGEEESNAEKTRNIVSSYVSG